MSIKSVRTSIAMSMANTAKSITSNSRGKTGTVSTKSSVSSKLSSSAAREIVSSVANCVVSKTTKTLVPSRQTSSTGGSNTNRDMYTSSSNYTSSVTTSNTQQRANSDSQVDTTSNNRDTFTYSGNNFSFEQIVSQLNDCTSKVSSNPFAKMVLNHMTATVKNAQKSLREPTTTSPLVQVKIDEANQFVSGIDNTQDVKIEEMLDSNCFEGQVLSTSCTAACIKSVLYYYGYDSKTQYQIYDELEHDANGLVGAEEVVECLENETGLDFKATQMNINSIIRELSKGNPVILYGSKTSDADGNSYDHAIICYGYGKDENGNDILYIYDPSTVVNGQKNQEGSYGILICNSAKSNDFSLVLTDGASDDTGKSDYSKATYQYKLGGAVFKYPANSK